MEWARIIGRIFSFKISRLVLWKLVGEFTATTDSTQVLVDFLDNQKLYGETWWEIYFGKNDSIQYIITNGEYTIK